MYCFISNFQALKALFNIAHCLGGLLGSAWLLLVECFDSLNQILLCHRKRMPVFDASVPEEEVAIITSGLSRLFESTVHLDDTAIHHLLMALGNSALSALAERYVRVSVCFVSDFHILFDLGSYCFRFFSILF